LKKLKKIIPYWKKHNSEYVNEHQEWMKDSQKLGFTKLADELEEAIGLLKKVNKHIDSVKEKMNR